MSRIDDALRRAEQVATSVNTGTPAAVAAAASELQEYPSEPARADVPIDTPIDVPIDLPLQTSIESKPTASAAAEVVDWRGLDDKLICSTAIKPIVIEQYRRTAAVLHQIQSDRGSRVVMVASAVAGEGKTLTACNVALTLSESFRRRVLLIDADLRRPCVHRMLHVDNVSGLNEALCAAEDRKLVIAEVSPRLSVLPAGRPNPDPMSSLTSARMQNIIAEASARFDWVVIDTPPVALLPDANLLAAMADVVLLVIGADTTPLRLIERAVVALDRKRIAGVVLNRVRESTPAYSYYEHYADGESRRRRRS